MDKLVYVTERLIFNLQDKVNGLERENLRLRLSPNKQTPITPESLEAIGFENWNSNNEELIYEFEGVDNTAYDAYHISFLDNEFVMLHCCEEIPLQFTSTEQITEWLKPFTKGENG